jgi:aryl-alcohol dehydrogenase-like predicted oxidoreductase
MPAKFVSPIFTPRRELGRTGFIASVLGIGDLADRSVPLGDCIATARRALDAGLNVIDTAPGYEDGYSEQIVGQAVKGRRELLFVIDKIDHPDMPVAPQVDGSLRRLELDFVDAFVVHGVSRLSVWKKLAAPGGGMEQLDACRRNGQLRFRGISSHHPAVLRAAVESGLCDIVMFAIGPFTDERYEREILPLCRERGVGTVCFKTFGSGKLLGDTEGYGRPLPRRSRRAHVRSSQGATAGLSSSAAEPLLPHLTVEECVRYTLTCDPDVALLGLSFPNEQDAAFAAAHSFSPMTEEEMAQTRERAAEAIKRKGKCWWNP